MANIGKIKIAGDGTVLGTTVTAVLGDTEILLPATCLAVAHDDSMAATVATITLSASTLFDLDVSDLKTDLPLKLSV